MLLFIPRSSITSALDVWREVPTQKLVFDDQLYLPRFAFPTFKRRSDHPHADGQYRSPQLISGASQQNGVTADENLF